VDLVHEGQQRKERRTKNKTNAKKKKNAGAKRPHPKKRKNAGSKRKPKRKPQRKPTQRPDPAASVVSESSEDSLSDDLPLSLWSIQVMPPLFLFCFRMQLDCGLHVRLMTLITLIRLLQTLRPGPGSPGSQTGNRRGSAGDWRSAHDTGDCRGLA